MAAMCWRERTTHLLILRLLRRRARNLHLPPCCMFQNLKKRKNSRSSRNTVSVIGSSAHHSSNFSSTLPTGFERPQAIDLLPLPAGNDREETIPSIPSIPSIPASTLSMHLKPRSTVAVVRSDGNHRAFQSRWTANDDDDDENEKYLKIDDVSSRANHPIQHHYSQQQQQQQQQQQPLSSSFLSSSSSSSSATLLSAMGGHGGLTMHRLGGLGGLGGESGMLEIIDELSLLDGLKEWARPVYEDPLPHPQVC